MTWHVLGGSCAPNATPIITKNMRPVRSWMPCKGMCKAPAVRHKRKSTIRRVFVAGSEQSLQERAHASHHEAVVHVDV